MESFGLHFRSFPQISTLISTRLGTWGSSLKSSSVLSLCRTIFFSTLPCETINLGMFKISTPFSQLRESVQLCLGHSFLHHHLVTLRAVICFWWKGKSGPCYFILAKIVSHQDALQYFSICHNTLNYGVINEFDSI